MTADLASEQSTQILDIVRTHGPIDISGICKLATLSSERVDV